MNNFFQGGLMATAFQGLAVLAVLSITYVYTSCLSGTYFPLTPV